MSEENRKEFSMQEMFDKIVEFNKSFEDGIAGFSFNRSKYRLYPDTVQFLSTPSNYRELKEIADKLGCTIIKGHLYEFDNNKVYVSFIYENTEFGTFVDVVDYERNK